MNVYRQRIQRLVDAFREKQAMRQLDRGGAAPEDDTALSESSAADATPTAGWRRQFRCSETTTGAAPLAVVIGAPQPMHAAV